MRYVESIIVGGGPAGSTCAWELRKHGRDVLILDKSLFPRPKLCAGWITGKVLDDLDFTQTDYPHPILKLDIRVHLPRVPFAIRRFPSAWDNYSIRRFEFDRWLLERSGSEVEEHTVRRITRQGDEYVIDDRYRCRHLIGAGGTMCPVRKILFPDRRQHAAQIVTLESEFEYPRRENLCHLYFCFRGLKGYSWYVPKANGFVNIGLGGKCKYFRKSGTNIHDHFAAFLSDLVKQGRLDSSTADTVRKSGHPYHLYSYRGAVKRDRCFVIGDAAGLASLDLGEGIGPAIETGIMAAREICGTGEYSRSETSRFSFSGTTRWAFEKFAVRKSTIEPVDDAEIPMTKAA